MTGNSKEGQAGEGYFQSGDGENGGLLCYVAGAGSASGNLPSFFSVYVVQKGLPTPPPPPGVQVKSADAS